MTPQEIEKELGMFNGTECYHHHSRSFVYTDGVQFLVEETKCYWLIDLVASYQHKFTPDVPFQIWNLKVDDDESAVATMQEDTDEPLLVKQEIPYTDFPLKGIKLYFITGVLLLPSEY